MMHKKESSFDDIEDIPIPLLILLTLILFCALLGAESKAVLQRGEIACACRLSPSPDKHSQVCVSFTFTTYVFLFFCENHRKRSIAVYPFQNDN